MFDVAYFNLVYHRYHGHFYIRCNSEEECVSFLSSLEQYLGVKWADGTTLSEYTFWKEGSGTRGYQLYVLYDKRLSYDSGKVHDYPVFEFGEFCVSQED